MTLTHRALCFITIIGLTGCASGPDVKSDLPNSLTVEFHNDATGFMTLRSGYLHTYTSARCEGEKEIKNKLSMANEETLTTIPFTPGKPLTFALTTLNAQGFKGNWGCSVTSTFTPTEGARYHAILQTKDDNYVCRVMITDQNDKVVPATNPEYTCPKTINGTSKNGQGYSRI